MKFIRLDQQLNCTFCQKSQQDAKKLIASSDHRAYICDECTAEPGRLKLISENAVTMSFACSFCSKQQCFLSYAPPRESETRARICGDCLDVCRRILKDVAKKR